ncbi:DUF4222 domain-containing protein, partial [Escherichia coli]|uniref:DUF4222 domain-containing protein n=1 Tax=Escherichia coli TaxID=562 RepID=UPI0020239501
MRQVNRWFKDHYGVPVRVIRWEPETQRVIYLREGYEHECFSPLEQFRRKFREMNRPGFPGECFICELRLPDHRFRWK